MGKIKKFQSIDQIRCLLDKQLKKKNYLQEGIIAEANSSIIIHRVCNTTFLTQQFIEQQILLYQ